MTRHRMRTGRLVSNSENTTERLRVVSYCRTSTSHEEQNKSFESQQAWYIEQIDEHPNWEMVGQYSDKGITGTKASKRPGFLQMIADAEAGKFDLIFTREVARFGRNTEEILHYVKKLRNECNVEVFFYVQGIWTYDKQAEFLLGIVGGMAQKEAEITSDRVLAGHETARSRGVIFGNGNVFALNLVLGENSIDNTYQLGNPEDVETVKLIFDMYCNKGYGIKKTASELIRMHRKNASGIVRWSPDRVSRILDNRIYSGYIGYNKSQCIDPIEHKRVKQPKNEIEYVKGNFPAIVDDELWQKAQAIKHKNSVEMQDSIRKGVRTPKDKWTKKLRCSCGSSYKRYKWHKTDKEISIGYTCANQVHNRSRSFIEKQGLDGIGYCNVESVCMWKLDLMLKKILLKLWKNPDNTVKRLMETIEANYIDVSEMEEKMEAGKLIREKERIEMRLQNLLDMRIDNEISKEDYSKRRIPLESRLSEVDKEITLITGKDKLPKDEVDPKEALADIRSGLEEIIDLNQKFVDEALVDELVERVVPYEGCIYKWYLNIGTDSGGNFDERDYIHFGDLDVSFEEAKAYRRKYGNFIRARQYQSLHAEIYIRL